MTPQEYLDWCKDMSERLEKYEYHFTNADKIRSMTDDELAKWLDSLDIICPSKERTYKCGNYDNCCGCLLEWLKEEVKE